MLWGTVVVVQFAERSLSIQENLGGFPPQHPRSSVSALNRKRSKVKVHLCLSQSRIDKILKMLPKHFIQDFSCLKGNITYGTDHNVFSYGHLQ